MQAAPFELLIEGFPVSDQTRNREKRHRWIEQVREQAGLAASASATSSDVEAGPLMVTIYYFTPAALPGDLDNIVKPILDGLKGVAYLDDRQIERLVVQKLEPETPWVFERLHGVLANAVGMSKPVLYIRVDADQGWRVIAC